MWTLVVVAWLAVATAVDPCSSFTSCETCVKDNGCGWCSTRVMYNDGSQGAYCAGPQTSTQPFTCTGIFSTEKCIRGYECDQGAGVCREAPPGVGVPKALCAQTCMAGPIADVYGCNATSNVCHRVPHGTPGSASREQCEAHCYTPAATVYKCSLKTYQCEMVPAGTPGSTSKEICEELGCGGYWRCDPKTLQCVDMGQGYNGTTKDECSKNCREENDPCEKYTTCSDCLASNPTCGWCSDNVTYANGRVGGRCAGVDKDILPFRCLGTYSTSKCPSATPAPAPASPSPRLPPRVNCPPGSSVLLQYNCADQTCAGCTRGSAAECVEPHCTYYCSGMCQPVPAWNTSFSWTCNSMKAGGKFTNATLVHYTKAADCTGPVNPVGIGGSGTYPLDTCAEPLGPNIPARYNTFECVECGESCEWH